MKGISASSRTYEPFCPLTAGAEFALFTQVFKICVFALLSLLYSPAALSVDESKKSPVFDCQLMLREIKRNTGTFVLFEPNKDFTTARVLRSGFVKMGEVRYRILRDEGTLEIITMRVLLKDRGLSKLLLGSILQRELPPQRIRAVILNDNEEAFNSMARKGANFLEAIRDMPFYKAFNRFGYGHIDFERSNLIRRARIHKLSEVASGLAPVLDNSSLLTLVLSSGP
jgi:hypothetical protein